MYPKGDVITLVTRYLKAGDTAIDVGACRGEISAVMVKCGAKVIAIEPDERSREQFRERLPHIKMLPFAAWSSAGPKMLYKNATPDESSLLLNACKESNQSVPVTTTTLDDVAGEQKIDLVKIDAQGSEPEILRGASKLLARCPVWILEVWPVGLKHAQSSPLALFEQLVDAGLTPLWADDRVVTRAELANWDGKPTFANWVCVR